ncbi:MAG TPA: nitrile hydratase subunit beta [Abditibacteriaceae bacterium]|jgi:nitrile hydratase
MKLQHRLGGLENLGPVNFERRVFVQPWEERIFGIHVAMMGLRIWTWAELRMGAEAMNPFDYFKYRYYEKWLGGISGFLVEKGYFTQAELDERTALYLQQSEATLPAGGESTINDTIIEYLRTGDSPQRDIVAEPKFKAGDRVLVKDVPTIDHTRLPGHLRGKTGVVDVVYEGAFTYFVSTGPDGLGAPMPVYCVCFDPKDIWGSLAEDNGRFYADIFETYLEAAPAE